MSGRHSAKRARPHPVTMSVATLLAGAGVAVAASGPEVDLENPVAVVVIDEGPPWPQPGACRTDPNGIVERVTGSLLGAAAHTEGVASATVTILDDRTTHTYFATSLGTPVGLDAVNVEFPTFGPVDEQGNLGSDAYWPNQSRRGQPAQVVRLVSAGHHYEPTSVVTAKAAVTPAFTNRPLAVGGGKVVLGLPCNDAPEAEILPAASDFDRVIDVLRAKIGGRPNSPYSHVLLGVQLAKSRNAAMRDDLPTAFHALADAIETSTTIGDAALTDWLDDFRQDVSQGWTHIGEVINIARAKHYTDLAHDFGVTPRHVDFNGSYQPMGNPPKATSELNLVGA